MSIYKQLSDFQNKVETIQKTATNPHFKSKYATLESVLETIREPLKEAKLCFTQLPQAEGVETIISSIDDETSYIKSFVPYKLSKADMQGLGSAITYARRYALVSMLGLIQEDDDGNEACKPKKQEAKQEQPKTITESQISQIQDLIIDTGTDSAAFLAYFKVKALSEMNETQANQAIAFLNKKKK